MAKSGMRYCPKCDCFYPLDPEHWFRNRAHPSGFQTYCKSCWTRMMALRKKESFRKKLAKILKRKRGAK